MNQDIGNHVNGRQIGIKDNLQQTKSNENQGSNNQENIELIYKNQVVQVPKQILQVHNLQKCFPLEIIQKILSSQELKELQLLLPKQEKIMERVLNGKNENQWNPFEQFLKQLKLGHFTKTYIEQQKLKQHLNDLQLLEHYKAIRRKFDIDQPQSQQFQYKQIDELFSNASEGENSSIDQLSIDNTDLSGYSSEDQQGLIIYQLSHKQQNFENASQQSHNSNEKPVNKKLKIYDSDVKQRIKTISTLQQSNQQQILQFRDQETERYKNPTKPYIYICADGTKAVVAPVAKKLASMTSARPREHILLKTDRPSHVTILCLVRDAAARLPNGVGTRADICQLLKESQYINENIDDEKLSNIVSGALDRLHYEDDPSVKYYSDKKLWIYLHKDRSINYSFWHENIDNNRSQKKKEYNQKYSNLKKQKMEEQQVL